VFEIGAQEGLDEDAFRVYSKPADTDPDLVHRYQDAGCEDLVVLLRELCTGEPTTLEQQLAALDRLAGRIMAADLV
jgi:hypothetical protein